VRTKLLTFLVLLSLSFAASAQRKALKNNPKYDRKPLHFGFSIGINYYDFRVQNIADLSADLPGYYNVRTSTSPGYSIYIISNLRLSDHWDFRFNPGFASTVRTLDFDVVNPFTQRRESVSRDIESSFLEFPFHFKFKSDRVGNYRLHLIAGPKYSIDLASDEDVIDDRVFKIKSNDISYEIGFGTDIYFEYFKFSPQIIASFGINNTRVEDNTFLASGIESIQTRAILINFTFE
jgi:hypothetical protein